MTDASTSTSTQCVAREATMTHMTGNYLEALDQECLQQLVRALAHNHTGDEVCLSMMIIKSSSTQVCLVSRSTLKES